MSQIITDQTFNFRDYLKSGDESSHVKTPEHWADEVAASFESPERLTGARTPWPKLDEKLRMRRGEYSIWAGYNNHGKSMLLSHVVAKMLCDGEKVCIASLEMKPKNVLRRMLRQVFGIANPDRDTVMDFFRWTRGKLWLYDQQGRVGTERVIALGRYTAKELGITQLVIDNLTCCGLAEDDYTGQGAFSEELAAHAHDTNQAVHLVAHMRKPDKGEGEPPGRYATRGAGKIIDLADNVMTVWRNREKEMILSDQTADVTKQNKARQEPDCVLSIEKNRYGEYEARVNLWFDPASLQYRQHPDAKVESMV